MGQPVSAERDRAKTTSPAEEQYQGKTLKAPSFQLFAGEDDAPSALEGLSQAPAQFQEPTDAATPPPNPYAGFPEALDKLLTSPSAEMEGSFLGFMGVYRGVLPDDCDTLLTYVYRARFWKADFEHSPQDYARMAFQEMMSLQPTLKENNVLASPIVAKMKAVLAPVLNPEIGSLDGSSMQTMLMDAIDQYRYLGPYTGKAEKQDKYAGQLNTVLVGASNILSPELSADVPGQILNPASPYNYLSYKAAGDLSSGQVNGLTALYRARWEAKKMSVRKDKISYAHGALKSVFDADKHRKMLRALTVLDDAGMEAQVTAIQTAITQFITQRMNAVLADETLTPIAKNGLPIPPKEKHSSSSHHKAAADITYEEGAETKPWNPTGGYTVDQAREELGDNPHMTLKGSNIGAYNKGGKYYPYNHGGRKYKIITRTTDRRFFGIKYGGDSGMTFSAIDSLLADPAGYFTEAQRQIVNSVRPHVSTEGGISSVNTWDSQVLTIAGRGEVSGRVTIMVNAAIALMNKFNTPVPELNAVLGLIGPLSAASAEGTAGNRFDMDKIHSLVELLENPAVHKAMTLAKLNDAIVGFYGKDFEVKGKSTLYTNAVDAKEDAKLMQEIKANNLHPVIMGIAIHNRLGGSGFKNPMKYSMRANKMYPQRSMYVQNNLPDYEQLSKQVAYMAKIRIQNKRNGKRGTTHVGKSSLKIIFSQKISDFNDYFVNEGAEMENGAYFNLAAATSVVPFWTGDRSFTASPSRPGEDHLIIGSGDKGSAPYYDCGGLLPSDVTDPESDLEDEASEESLEELEVSMD